MEATPYALNPETEVAYLFANGVRLARLAYEAPGDVPSMGGETLHVFFELGDHLGSTSVVLDKATGELVERSTYQAYGGSESDYRPERWKHFREDYRFTGKEEDVEVGLIYFGKRFLNPLLNRWVSADPLAVHGLVEDPNVYAYVNGRALKLTDPLGLGIGDYLLGLASEGARTAGKAVKNAVWDDPKARVEKLVKDPGGFVKDRLEEHVDRTMAPITGAVDLIKRTAKIPEQVEEASKTGSDKEAGAKALKPVVTIMEATATIGSAFVGGAGKSAVAGETTAGKGLFRRLTTKKPAVEPPATKVATEAAPSLEGAAKPAAPAPEVKAPTTAEKPPPKTQPEPAPLRDGGCFVAGTLVLTERGWANIEDIRVGDLVLSMPDDGDETGGPDWRRVEAAYERITAIIDLSIEAPDGTTAVIGTTHEHPFWVGGRGWLHAEDIRPDDYVWSVERGWLWVRAVHERPEQEPVYNVRVETDRTYFVSKLGVWVHNTSSIKAAARQNLKDMGLADVELAGRSYNSGRKALEASGFKLDATTDSGRKVFVNQKTGARVTYDGTDKSLGAGQKPHWTSAAPRNPMDVPKHSRNFGDGHDVPQRSCTTALCA